MTVGDGGVAQYAGGGLHLHQWPPLCAARGGASLQKHAGALQLIAPAARIMGHWTRDLSGNCTLRCTAGMHVSVAHHRAQVGQAIWGDHHWQV